MTSPETSNVIESLPPRSGRALAGIKWKRTLARVLAALDIPRIDRRAGDHGRTRQPYGVVTLIGPPDARTYTAPLDDPCLDELLRAGYVVHSSYHVDPAHGVAKVAS